MDISPKNIDRLERVALAAKWQWADANARWKATKAARCVYRAAMKRQGFELEPEAADPWGRAWQRLRITATGTARAWRLMADKIPRSEAG